MTTELVKNKDYDLAYLNYSEIRQRKELAAGNLLELGRLFKDNKDKKLYLLLGYDSFNEFLGDPEISLARSTVFSLIQIYEVFIQQLDSDPTLLRQIGHGKLQVIIPVVKDDPKNWLFKAKELSRTDLKEELREYKGLPSIEPIRVEKAQPEFNIKDYKDYLEFVRDHGCIICGADECEAHHFPKTKGASGKDHWCIPLCRECHGEADHTVEFMTKHRNKIFEYFYSVILVCYTIIDAGLGGKE